MGRYKNKIFNRAKIQRYVKRYGFFSFARKFGDKYCKKLPQKRVVQKPAKATKDLTGNKIAGKITSSGKSKECDKIKKVEEIYILPEKGQQIINDLRLF